MMLCNEIHRALADFYGCDETEAGSRIVTHCLYPSFENVRVYVAKVGDGFHVHDGAGAFTTAWLHGRDEPVITKSLNEACERFSLYLSERTLVAKIESIDWLPSAVVSVANGSALAATDAVAKIVAAAEEALVDRIERNLAETLGPNTFAKNVDIKGVSGGSRHFDFLVGKVSEPRLLINSVTPHRNSIASKYVSFADTEVDKGVKFAVYDKALENDDILLLQQVASVVPLASLGAGARRSLYVPAN